MYVWIMKTITINGKEVYIIGEEIAYEEICNIANPPQQTVTYSRGPAEKPDGTLYKGKSVKVANGMVIECVFTGNA